MVVNRLQINKRCFAGGYINLLTTINVLNMLLIATTGNAKDFGDLTVTIRSKSKWCSTTKDVFGGWKSNHYINTLII